MYKPVRFNKGKSLVELEAITQPTIYLAQRFQTIKNGQVQHAHGLQGRTERSSPGTPAHWPRPPTSRLQCQLPHTSALAAFVSTRRTETKLSTFQACNQLKAEPGGNSWATQSATMMDTAIRSLHLREMISITTMMRVGLPPVIHFVEVGVS